ncbi:MAG: gamma-glutamyl-gamma-aminobutyrate hydrolase family protein [Anaerovoracaceae bacterium]
MKPLIGITCNYSQQDLGTSTGIGVPGQHWTLLATDYVHSVEKAGGIPMLLPFTEDTQTLFDLIEYCDGILITGGDDVAPFLYGEDVSHRTAHLEPVRDKQEYLLMKHLLDHSSVPLLGICRGCQILNVAAGGTLHQDLTSQERYHVLLNASRDSFAHRVLLKKGSGLEEIIGSDSLLTNSYHHQAVKDAAPGFDVTGTTADGVIEAIEKNGDRFVLGVQWHPEMTWSCPINQKIFQAFIRRCEKQSAL